MGGEFGWPQDSVDGALYALVATGSLRARLNGTPVNATAIPQNSIGTVALDSRLADHSFQDVINALRDACESFAQRLERHDASATGGDPNGVVRMGAVQ